MQIHTHSGKAFNSCCWSIKHHLLQPDTGTVLYKDKYTSTCNRITLLTNLTGTMENIEKNKQTDHQKYINKDILKSNLMLK